MMRQKRVYFIDKQNNVYAWGLPLAKRFMRDFRFQRISLKQYRAARKLVYSDTYLMAA